MTVSQVPVRIARPTALTGEYDAVLIDLDGTLVDSQASIDRAWREWCANYEVELSSVVSLIHGRTARDLIRLVRPLWSSALIAEAAQFQVSAQERDPNPGTLAPGAMAMLDVLQMRHRWAVVTACSAHLARHRLTSTGLPIPPVLVTLEDVSHGKPDPESYLLGAFRSDVEPANCLVIEDAPAGVAAGRSAGCTVAAVTSTHGATELSEASCVLTDLSDLVFGR